MSAKTLLTAFCIILVVQQLMSVNTNRFHVMFHAGTLSSSKTDPDLSAPSSPRVCSTLEQRTKHPMHSQMTLSAERRGADSLGSQSIDNRDIPTTDARSIAPAINQHVSRENHAGIVDYLCRSCIILQPVLLLTHFAVLYI